VVDDVDERVPGSGGGPVDEPRDGPRPVGRDPVDGGGEHDTGSPGRSNARADEVQSVAAGEFVLGDQAVHGVEVGRRLDDRARLDQCKAHLPERASGTLAGVLVGVDMENRPVRHLRYGPEPEG